MSEHEQKCELCGSILVYSPGHWPMTNTLGCVDMYHDGGFGSTTLPGYCGTRNQYWRR